MHLQQAYNASIAKKLSEQIPDRAKDFIRKVVPAGLLGPVEFTESSNPVVSVIIPVYRHLNETWRCLASLAKTQCSAEFEIIVVDDHSMDHSVEKLRTIKGIRLVEKQNNEGFVRACNSGLRTARGEFVVFLNNDTVVDPNWLQPLLDSMEDPAVGLVGSKLLFPNGRLQEAGGVIFSDGTGWNYGRGQNPNNHSFNYVRDVDYCSGASIMVRKPILDTLKGFDERFAPAYYEDTDLAFSVRKLGYRTIYQPASIVVHFEGVSNGTDLTTGIKKYQKVNHEKFVKKWAAELKKQHPSPTDDPNFEIERCVHSDRVVFVVDDHIPTPDLDSGSLRMTRILLGLKELGYEPILAPQSPGRYDPWSEWFGQKGIQVMYRTPGPNGWECISPDYMALLLAGSIKVIILSRVGVASAFFFPLTHALPDVPVIFDTVDLHGLREKREAELSGETKLLKLAHRTEQLEIGLMHASDVTLVVSSAEKELLARTHPEVNVAVVSNVHVPVDHKEGTSNRSGIVFIGSFQHKPNADAIKWYLEQVDPLLRVTHPDVEVSIFGKNPPKDLVRIAPPHVTFAGYAKNLTEVYDPARVAIAPLRYGAGVKGKVGEALTWGVPVVTTSIGAEGMELSHQETAWISDDPQEFANGISKLLDNDELWNKLATAGEEHINAIMGPETLKKALNRVLSELSVSC
jgi:GT2 family glycosyltransferase